MHPGASVTVSGLAKADVPQPARKRLARREGEMVDPVEDARAGELAHLLRQAARGGAVGEEALQNVAHHGRGLWLGLPVECVDGRGWIDGVHDGLSLRRKI